jgi:hypothetical protein
MLGQREIFAVENDISIDSHKAPTPQGKLKTGVCSLNNLSHIAESRRTRVEV